MKANNCDCDYTIRDIVDIINHCRSDYNLDFMEYQTVLSTWHKLNRFGRYGYRKIIGNNYIFTEAQAVKIAEAIWQRNYKARRAA